jgi:hypothetical protein
MTAHLIAMFVSLAHQRGWGIHSTHGPYGWFMWVQPHNYAFGIEQLRGHFGSYVSYPD